MSSTQFIKYAVAVVLTGLFSLSTWLYIHSHVDSDTYQQGVSKVIDIQNMSASLNQQTLLVQKGHVRHFDELAHLEFNLENAINQLDSRSIEQSNLINSIRQQLSIVSQIKATFAIYKNSLLYFPKGTQLLLLQVPKNKILFNQLEQLEHLIMLFAANHFDHSEQQRLLDFISVLKQDSALLALDESHSEALALLLKHAENIVDTINTLDELNKTLLELQIPYATQRAISLLDLVFHDELIRASRVKQYFYITIFMLILSVLFIWHKQKVAIKQLQHNSKALTLASNVFSQAHEGINITDANGLIIDVNPAFSDITGYSLDDVMGKNPSILNSGRQDKSFYKEMWQSLLEHDFWQGEVWNRKKGGEFYAQLLSISTIKNEQHEVTNFVGIFSDITDTKRQHEQINLMAHYDVLTQLPNRVLFTDRFHQAIAHSKRTETQLAVCFLDLDQFKPINDQYGHEVGDQLLIEVAQRIQANIREEDTVSRQGGDEFALLLNEIVSFAQCEQTLDRIHHALSQPFVINDIAHTISASTGITLYPSDDSDIDTLLRHADHAMYLAKQAGRNRYHLFNPQQDKAIVHKHQRLHVIQQAFNDEQFELYYQPKVNMVTGKVVGAEALIRWNHPEQGLIPPMEFLPVIAGTDLEIMIGEWVIAQALHQLHKWQQQGINLEVSVNISPYHLHANSFTEKLEAQLTKYPSVDSRSLQLEVLESSALGDLNAIRKTIQYCLHVLGVRVALDDFGTGYSSLTHLRNLPVNDIKIDQSFVRDMLDDANDYVIVDGVIALAASFGRSVIAEGVETIEQGLMLIVMGCHNAQGYAISKPLPVDQFIKWLSHYQPKIEWLKAGKKRYSLKTKKIALFKLVTEKWHKTYLNNIISSPESVKPWPILAKKKEHCRYWIDDARKQNLFSLEQLNQLEKAHNHACQISKELVRKYQFELFDEARSGLAELQQAFDDMSLVLSRCT